jgi:hypothetical protein
MTSTVQNYLRGAGSLFNLMPSHDYSRYVPKRNPALRLSGHFARAGLALNNATVAFANEQSAERKRK